MVTVGILTICFISSVLWLYPDSYEFCIIYTYFGTFSYAILDVKRSPRESMVRDSAVQAAGGKISVRTTDYPSSAILLFVRPWGVKSFKNPVKKIKFWLKSD
jgi:hypothetical protein